MHAYMRTRAGPNGARKRGTLEGVCTCRWRPWCYVSNGSSKEQNVLTMHACLHAQQDESEEAEARAEELRKQREALKVKHYGVAIIPGSIISSYLHASILAGLYQSQYPITQPASVLLG
eukprot:TRINITY_DN7286_c0_g1_i2.p1 TRINITY_DN7286_c0_g1~~TRINITY_DN7286_c0_g1_i2.p1  ORF type:complete len:119 (+),score=11.83 TRINITY_DN7286_c0_g1_i2:100-456(+)